MGPMKMNKKVIRLSLKATMCVVVLFNTLNTSYGQKKRDIAHAQQFLIPSNAETGDYIGEIQVNGNWDTIGDLRFHLLNDLDGSVALEGSILVVNKAGYFQKNMKYQISYEISDNGFSDTTISEINVADSDLCIFIDPQGGGTSTSWGPIDNNFKDGYYYLQKRGTTIEHDIQIDINASNVTIGAYGRGSRPYIKSTYPNQDGSWDDSGILMQDQSNVVVRDIKIESVYCNNAIRFNSPGPNCKIDNCDIIGSPGYHEGRGIYIRGNSGVKIINNHVHDIGDDGIFINQSKNAEIAYNFIYDIGVYDYDRGDCIQGATNDNQDGLYIHHNYLKKPSSNKQVIMCGSSNSGEKLIIKYNRILLNPECVSYLINVRDGLDSVIVVGNYMENGWYQGFKSTGGLQHLEFHNNIVVKGGNRVIGIEFDCQTANVYNNTFYKPGDDIFFIECTTSTIPKVKIKNNICYFDQSTDQLLDGNDNNIELEMDYNMFYPNVDNRFYKGYSAGSNSFVGEPEFVDPSNRNFHIRSESSPNVGAGINVGLNHDFDKESIKNAGNPDIGADQYAEVMIDNLPPSLKSTSLSIASSLENGDMVTDLDAYDPNGGQQLIYSIQGGNNENTFGINSETGELYIENAAGLELQSSFNLNILVQDNGDTPLSCQALVSISITSSGNEKSGNSDEDIVILDQVLYLAENVQEGFGVVEIENMELVGDLTFSIVAGNFSNAFEINEETGEISLSTLYLNNTEALRSEYNLVVRATDSNEENGYGNILVVVQKNTNIIYIDPDNTGDPLADGSIDHPLASWKSIQWKPGYSYLQKRGTTTEVGKIEVKASDVVLGAYGSGSRPVIQSTSNEYVIAAINKKNVNIQDLVISAPGAIGCIYFIGSEGNENRISHCQLEGALYGAKIIDGDKYIIEYNTFLNMGNGVYSTAGEMEIYYNVFNGSDMGLNVASYTSDVKLYNNVFYDNHTGVSSSYGALEVYNNIFYLTGSADMAISQRIDKIISDHNIFYPEQDGFIEIAGEKYGSIGELNNYLGLDMHSLNVDPVFVDVYNNNFSVELGSPCIDKGKNTGMLSDYFGSFVPRGNAPDIGIGETDYLKSAFLDVPGLIENKASMKVYPNPSNGVFNIEISDVDQEIEHIMINDLSGRIVYENHQPADFFDKYLERIDVSHLPKGVYSIMLKMSDRIISDRVVLY